MLQWRSLATISFYPTDEQLKSLNEKNKELEAAQDRNAAIQVLEGPDDKLKGFGSPVLLQKRMQSISKLGRINISINMYWCTYLHFCMAVRTGKLCGFFK